jgi:hypothetical protein
LQDGHEGSPERKPEGRPVDREDETMISWEGSFNWQAYAMTGRPDFLNYLNSGDVTWEALWDFYRRQSPPQEAVRALSRLFHLFLSSRYEEEGCWLDPEGEICARLRAWAAFAQDTVDRVPIGEVQADLAGLVSAGLVTPLYYQAAYLVFMEASVDRHASTWTEDRSAAAIPDPRDLPEPAERRLPVYHPGPARFTHLQSDPEWDAALNSLIASEYSSWNSAYAANLPDPDHEEVWTTAGGEG